MKNTIFFAASIVAMSGLAYIRFSNELSDDEYKEFLVERTEPCCGNGGGGWIAFHPCPIQTVSCAWSRKWRTRTQTEQEV